MKILSFLLLTSMVVSGCMSYQYGVVSSNIAKTEDGDVVIENDSVRLIYRFSGRNAPAVISVYNKLDVRLYLAWRRSALVVDAQSISHRSDEFPLNASASGMQVQLTESVSSSYHHIEGSVTVPRHISFVPPDSYIVSRP